MATVLISAKCSDMCSATVRDDDGNTVKSASGYAPSIGAINGGDYLDIEVDLETGKIVGWEPVTVEEAVEELTGM